MRFEAFKPAIKKNQNLDLKNISALRSVISDTFSIVMPNVSATFAATYGT